MATSSDVQLRRLSTFAGSFFAALSLLVAAFPHLNRISEALPYTPKPTSFVNWASTIMTLAIVGGGFLVVKVSSSTRRRTGTLWLIVAVLVALAYTSVGLKEGPSGYQPRIPNSDGVLILVYLCVYGMLARGFFEMSLFAYAVRRGDIPSIDGLPIPTWRKVVRWWRKRGDSRAEAREKRLRAKIRHLEAQVERAEVERRRREAKADQTAAMLQRKIRRRTFLVWLILAAVGILSIFIALPYISEAIGVP